ncbi:MAG: hypothetical protein ACP5IJ_02975, partial [Candidatus Nanoarchaeia archaeon]
LGKKVLIRGHQPLANKPLYDNRCVTIVTSTAYKDKFKSKRRIAVVDLSKKVETLDDIFIEDVD